MRQTLLTTRTKTGRVCVRIKNTNAVLGVDFKLSEHINHSLQFVLSADIHNLFNVLEITALSTVCKVTSWASAFNLE